MRVQAIVAALAFAAITEGATRTNLPPDLTGIGIEQKLNAQIPLDTQFRDETGNLVPLRNFFGSKPVLLAPVYFRCPMLCSQVLRGVVSGLRPLAVKPGRDFEVVALSFDSGDTPAEAFAKREQYSHSYSSKAGTRGWHFLVGDEKSIKPVMDALGFHYRWDPVHNIFVHASGVMVLTPDGHVARYLYGVEYEPKDLKLSLVEASRGRIGSPVDQILLFCYHYDPTTGKYTAAVMGILRLAGIFTLIAMGGCGWWLWRRDLREHRV